MKHWKAEDIRKVIEEKLPEGKVIPRHDKRGHFYEIDLASESSGRIRFYEDGYTLPLPQATGGYISAICHANPVYPSVTGKLQRLKDEGLVNYKMNRAIEYLRNFMFSGWSDTTQESLMEKIDNACNLASRVSQDILVDAGDVGTRIHDMREVIFRKWINEGKRPVGFDSLIPEEEKDIRVISAMRALEKFCVENDYIPVELELRVYSHKLKTAGSLDDIGLMRQVLREGTDPSCTHENEIMVKENTGKHTCLKCGYQYRYMFVLMDLKSSNQFKDHYFLQVALYWKFFTEITKLKPERCFILKVSKEDGTYKIEDLMYPAKLAQYATHLIKVDEGVEFIKSLRKDNQKVVAPLMQL